MKRQVLVLVIGLMTSPVLAALDVNMVLVDSDTIAVVYRNADYFNLPRAFALTVAINGTGKFTAINGYKTGESTAASKGYGIYPARIQIDSTGTVTGYGNPLADGNDPGAAGTGLGTNTVILEFGSLYYGEPNAPATSGTLCTLNFTKGTATQFTMTTENTYRGGIVLEDGTVVTVSFSTAPPGECLSSTAAAYSVWVQFGRPNCWCYQRNCRGDINGTKAGIYWVSSADLDVFRRAFHKTDSGLLYVTNGICADFNRAKAGIYRVSSADLDIFRLYFNKTETNVPVCPMTDINFWKN